MHSWIRAVVSICVCEKINLIPKADFGQLETEKVTFGHFQSNKISHFISCINASNLGL